MTYPSGQAQGHGGPGGQQPGQGFGAPGQGPAQPQQGPAQPQQGPAQPQQGPAQPQQGPGQPGTQQLHPVAPKRPNPLAGIGVATLLPLAVLVLALISYFISFSSQAGGVGFEVYLLLAGGLLAAMSAAPKAPPAVLPIGAMLSVVGGLGILASVVRAGAVTTSIILILVFGILQLLAAVGAYLVDCGVLTLPPPTQGGPRPPQAGWSPGPVPQPGQPPNAGSAGYFAGQQTVQQPLQAQQQPQQGQRPDLFSGE